MASAGVHQEISFSSTYSAVYLSTLVFGTSRDPAALAILPLHLLMGTPSYGNGVPPPRPLDVAVRMVNSCAHLSVSATF